MSLLAYASQDDLELLQSYHACHAAIHAGRELTAWTGEGPRITITRIPDIAPGGEPVSVLTVTDRNMPFLYDSVMGEVTSRHRDLTLAVHPILVVKKGRAPILFDPDAASDPSDRVSHIHIHLAD